MKIIRARNPMAVDYLKDWIQDSEGNPSEAHAESLKKVMTDEPDSVYLAIAFETETEEPRAFVLAFDLPQKEYIWLHQVYAETSVPNDVKKRLFMRLQAWTEFCGKHEIRAETRRSSDALTRRWGFQPFSVIMNYRIDEMEDNNNGTERQRTGASDESDAGSEEDSERSGELSRDSSGGRGSELPDAESARVTRGGRSGDEPDQSVSAGRSETGETRES